VSVTVPGTELSMEKLLLEKVLLKKKNSASHFSIHTGQKSDIICTIRSCFAGRDYYYLRSLTTPPNSGNKNQFGSQLLPARASRFENERVVAAVIKSVLEIFNSWEPQESYYVVRRRNSGRGWREGENGAGGWRLPRWSGP